MKTLVLGRPGGDVAMVISVLMMTSSVLMMVISTLAMVISTLMMTSTLLVMTSTPKMVIGDRRLRRSTAFAGADKKAGQMFRYVENFG